MRRIWLVCVLATGGGSAFAHPPPHDTIDIAVDNPPPPPPPPVSETVDWRETPATFEWSSWIGFGVGAARDPSPVLARGAVGSPPPTEQHLAWSFDAGLDVTVPLTHAVRIGPWIGLQGLEPMAGAELQVTRAPAHLDMFWYDGEGMWTLRAGGGPDHATAAIGWGYRCPWLLYGPNRRMTRYEIGGRIVLNVNRAYADPTDWSTTLGIEFEPVGTFRYVFGIKSWYHEH